MSEKDLVGLMIEESDTARPKRTGEGKDYRELAGYKKKPDKSKMVDKVGKKKDSTSVEGGEDGSEPASKGGLDEQQDNGQQHGVVGEGAVGGTTLEESMETEVMTPEQFEAIMQAQRDELKASEDRQRQAYQCQQLEDMKLKIAQANEKAAAAAWQAEQIKVQATLLAQEEEIRKLKAQQLQEQVKGKQEELHRLRTSIPEKGPDMGEKPSPTPVVTPVTTPAQPALTAAQMIKNRLPYVSVEQAGGDATLASLGYTREMWVNILDKMREEEIAKEADIKRTRFVQETGFQAPDNVTPEMIHDMLLKLEGHRTRLEFEEHMGGARLKEPPFSGTPTQRWEQLRARIEESKAREENKDIVFVQQKARDLMETHKKLVEDIQCRANIRNQPVASAPATATPTPTPVGGPPTSQPLTGWQHLYNLNMATDAAMQQAGQPTTTITQAYEGKNINRNPLGIDTSFQYGMPEKGEDSNKSKMTEGTGTNAKEVKDSKVKSGKFAKSHTELLRQEVWPHSAISKKYSKCPTFDNMDFEQFVAGEAKIIYSMYIKEHAKDRALGRLRVLILIAHWMCKTRNWSAIRAVYESIIEEVKLGDQDWTDDFSGHETVLPTCGPVAVNGNASNKDKNDLSKKTADIYWCKAYQTGACDQSPPHMVQIKQDEPPVPVLHICASCWNTQC